MFIFECGDLVASEEIFTRFLSMVDLIIYGKTWSRPFT